MRVGRKKYVRNSKLQFQACLVFTVLVSVFGPLYVVVMYEYIDVSTVVQNVALTVLGAGIATYILYRLYMSDLKLLDSDEKYMKRRDTGIGEVPLGGDDIGD